MLGTESEAGYNGARRVHRTMWSPSTWRHVQSNLEIAAMASGNPWYATRLGIREGLPEVVEEAAVANRDAWWLRPSCFAATTGPRHRRRGVECPAGHGHIAEP